MWPRGAIAFLRDLEANNDREWFKANRSRYDEHLRAPAEALASELAHLGEPRFFRPYRDTRFSPGPPIKENIAFLIGSMETGGHYVELSLDGLVLGAGVYHPAPDQLDRWRRAVDDRRRAGALTRALAKASGAGLELLDPDLKRAPRGYPPDHPRLDLLRRKRLVVMRRDEVGRWLHTPECTERIRDTLSATRPFVRWIGEQVGPSAKR